MNTGNEIKKVGCFDIIKWVLVVLLLIGSVIGSVVYNDCNFYLKNIIIFTFLVMSVSIFLTTKMGKLIVSFLEESYVELEKVVWPTYRETFNTTLIVVVVTGVISLLLWGLDAVLVRMISFGLRW